MQETNQNMIKKINGSKERDSEIDFEEQTRGPLITSLNNDDLYQENDDN